jgi:flagellar motility protein MotE (MotC chaperone)
MRKIEEIEQQIQTLSREEFAELREWFLERDWQTWDAQIEADSKAGKLDRLVSDAKADYAAGRARKL